MNAREKLLTMAERSRQLFQSTAPMPHRRLSPPLANLRGVLTAVALLVLLLSPGRAEKPSIPIVDTHVHLWDLSRPEGITWIAPDHPVLYRSFLPARHEPVAKANGVTAVVVVQAGQSLPDNQWNLDITAHNKQLYRGVVGNLSKVIGTAEFAPLFAQLCQDERYVGYRLSGRYQEKLGDAFFRDLELTAAMGRTVDFLPDGYTLDDIAEIARRVPKLKIILDHFGNVRLDQGTLDPAWADKLRAVAKHPNVYCKVSALYGRVKAQPAPKEIAFYQGVLDLAFASFGEDRLVYGSDWPVSETSGDYASVLALTRAGFAARGDRVLEKLFHENAVRFYGIGGIKPATQPADQPEASRPPAR
jgi:L-fuconolactonase